MSVTNLIAIESERHLVALSACINNVDSRLEIFLIAIVHETAMQIIVDLSENVLETRGEHSKFKLICDSSKALTRMFVIEIAFIR